MCIHKHMFVFISCVCIYNFFLNCLRVNCRYHIPFPPNISRVIPKNIAIVQSAKSGS